MLRLVESEDAEVMASWDERLELAAADPLTGKVLCVCAAAAIAKHVQATRAPCTLAAEALALLLAWIDGPTAARFDRITQLLFADAPAPTLDDVDGVTWFALRTATSSVGNHEAAWALSSTCLRAAAAGMHPNEVRARGLCAVVARMT